MRLVLSGVNDTLDLEDVLYKGAGVQALTGVTGLGLPPVAVQWLEGAGDGARYRGRRVLPRDIDLPLLVDGNGDQSTFQQYLRRLTLILAGPAMLRFVEDDGEEWSTMVVRTGGGGYTYGIDNDGRDALVFTITVRAGDPFFTSSHTQQVVIGETNVVRGMLPRLANLKLTNSQAMGSAEIVNDGDANAYPIWEVYGPGDNFKAVSSDGQTLSWVGHLNGGEVLTLDTKNGTVYDQSGTNRYSNLAGAPRFFAFPPGPSSINVSFVNTLPGTSKVVCTWRPRRQMVV